MCVFVCCPTMWLMSVALYIDCFIIMLCNVMHNNRIVTRVILRIMTMLVCIIQLLKNSTNNVVLVQSSPLWRKQCHPSGIADFHHGSRGHGGRWTELLPALSSSVTHPTVSSVTSWSSDQVSWYGVAYTPTDEPACFDGAFEGPP